MDGIDRPSRPLKRCQGVVVRVRLRFRRCAAFSDPRSSTVSAAGGRDEEEEIGGQGRRVRGVMRGIIDDGERNQGRVDVSV